MESHLLESLSPVITQPYSMTGQSTKEVSIDILLRHALKCKSLEN